MNKKIKLNTFIFMAFVFFIAGSIYFYSKKVEAQTPTVYLTGNAWSSNIGWISFATSTKNTTGVTIDSSGNINGYGWSSSIGWIKFGGLSNFPTGSGTIAANAKFSTTTGKITGWARACTGTYDGVCGGTTYTPPSTSILSWSAQTNAGKHIWAQIAVSSDGTKLAAAATYNSDYLYTSINGGINWTPQTSLGKHHWAGVTTSLDGTKIIASEVDSGYGNPGTYVSTNTGSTWSKTSTTTLTWLTSSSDGVNVIGIGGYSIFTSSNSGATWTQRSNYGGQNPTLLPNSITTSSDGKKIAVVDQDANIYISSDGGVSWVIHTIPGNNSNFASVSSNSDGTKLVASTEDGYLYTSTDSGNNWTQRLVDLRAYHPSSIADEPVLYSYDGTTIIAQVYLSSINANEIYFSKDGGNTWSSTNASYAGASGISLVSSSDGSKLFTGYYYPASSGGYIYSYPYTYTQSSTTTDSRIDGWDGWISLSGTGYGISLGSGTSTNSTSTALNGNAWGSDVVGWLNFNGGSGAGGTGTGTGGTNNGGTVAILNLCALTNSCVSIPVIPPTFVLSVAGSACSVSGINLSWSVVNNATSYNIYRSTTSSGTYIKIASGITSTSYIDPFSPGYNGQYYYEISAVNSAGESSLSAPVQSANCGSNICSNGASNYPTCSTCGTGQYYIPNVGCAFKSSSSVGISNFSVIPNTIIQGGNCNLSWTLTPSSPFIPDASSTCSIYKGSNLIYQITPAVNGNYNGSGATGVQTETTYKLTCGEFDSLGNVVATTSKYATCYINQNFKEVNK